MKETNNKFYTEADAYTAGYITEYDAVFADEFNLNIEHRRQAEIKARMDKKLLKYLKHYPKRLP